MNVMIEVVFILPETIFKVENGLSYTSVTFLVSINGFLILLKFYYYYKFYHGDTLNICTFITIDYNHKHIPTEYG